MMTEIILLAYGFASMIVRGGVRIAMVDMKPTYTLVMFAPFEQSSQAQYRFAPDSKPE